jgi:NTE family protein
MARRPLRIVPERSPRVGLVLGAGGVLGAAWMAGVLVALQSRLVRPLGTADLIVGTSAGSVIAAALRCGFDVEQIVEHQRGSQLVALPHLSQLDRESGLLPTLPRLRIGSPRLLANTALAPHRVRPWVAASGLVPQGRGQLHHLGALVDAMLSAEGGDPAGPLGTWPDRGETWIIAVDYASGRRIAFGRAGAPAAPLADAVVASCSIPGWYEPKSINGRRYVDGGVCSSTSLDLAARMDLDEVYVLAPMASYVLDRPWHPAVRLERMVRRLITIGLGREERKVRATGASVTVLTPGPEDLAVMGANLMNPGPRQLVLETSLRTSAAALAERAEPTGTTRAAA